MKSWHLIFLCLMISATTAVSRDMNTTIYRADSPQIHYVGRVMADDNGAVNFNWSGTYLSFTFSGKNCSMRASDSGVSYYNLFIDDEFKSVVKVAGQDTVIHLASGLKGKEHRLKLQKRSEGGFGHTTIKCFMLPAKSALLPSESPKRRLIEFIGDSFTCGFGTEGLSREEPFKVETEDCNKAYACILSRYFDSDYVLLSHSGFGAVRNYGDSVRVSSNTMKNLMMNTFDAISSPRWDFKKYRPDLVVINLGINDFSEGKVPVKEEFTKAYKTIISQIRNNYGDVPVLCVCPHIGEPAYSYIRDLVLNSNDGNLRYTSPLTGVFNFTTDLGSAWHPNYSGQKKIAMSLIPYVSTITGWELTGKAVF